MKTINDCQLICLLAVPVPHLSASVTHSPLHHSIRPSPPCSLDRIYNSLIIDVPVLDFLQSATILNQVTMEPGLIVAINVQNKINQNTDNEQWPTADPI